MDEGPVRPELSAYAILVVVGALVLVLGSLPTAIAVLRSGEEPRPPRLDRSVAGGMAAFTGVYAVVMKSKYEDPATPDEDRPSLRSQLRYVGSGTFIVGVGLLATAGYLYFKAPGKEMVSDGTAFAPVISGDQLGFAVTGAF